MQSDEILAAIREIDRVGHEPKGGEMTGSYCTKPQPKGFYCVLADGHQGDCDLYKKPSRWSAWWDRLGRSLFT